MKEKSLRTILLEEINKTPNWLSKGELGMIAERAGYLPESCGRHLRNMAELRPDHEPEIQVSYYQGKRKQKLSRYARLGEQKPIPKRPTITIINGIAVLS